jgi:hypothetical protein
VAVTTPDRRGMEMRTFGLLTQAFAYGVPVAPCVRKGQCAGWLADGCFAGRAEDDEPAIVSLPVHSRAGGCANAEAITGWMRAWRASKRWASRRRCATATMLLPKTLRPRSKEPVIFLRLICLVRRVILARFKASAEAAEVAPLVVRERLVGVG